MKKAKMIYMEVPRKTKILEFDVPKAEPGAVVVEILRASVCGTDLKIWSGHHSAYRGDFHIGHEGIGRIVELGAGRTCDNAGNPVKPGDKVVFVYFPTCMRCKCCLRGNYAACLTNKKNYVKSPLEYPHFTGTYGTHTYLLPDQFFYKVPENIPDYVAASANCALSQVYYGLDKADLQAGETILIQGAGGLGLHAVALSKWKGAKVIIIDAVKSRLELAKRFGADHVIDMSDITEQQDRIELVKSYTDGFGPDVGIELAGNAGAFLEGIRMMSIGGRYVEIGTSSAESKIEFAPGEMTRKSLTVFTAVHYAPQYLWKALMFLKDNWDKYPYEEFNDREYRLEDFEEMMERVSRREVLRTCIVPGLSSGREE